MLTRFVRIQLAIFAIVGIIGIIAMVLFYIQAPTLLGIGRMTVTLELPATGGLYPGGPIRVTTRGDLLFDEVGRHLVVVADHLEDGHFGRLEQTERVNVNH